jgi:hypothetical protein
MVSLGLGNDDDQYKTRINPKETRTECLSWNVITEQGHVCCLYRPFIRSQSRGYLAVHREKKTCAPSSSPTAYLIFVEKPVLFALGTVPATHKSELESFRTEGSGR